MDNTPVDSAGAVVGGDAGGKPEHLGYEGGTNGGVRLQTEGDYEEGREEGRSTDSGPLAMPAMMIATGKRYQ